MSLSRRALLSVSSKTGLLPFAQTLTQLGFEIISTGGTAASLRAAAIPVTEVSALTGFPEIMDGRVKTLHPAVHAGLLARRGVDDEVLARLGLGWIDLLVVNLYPFEEVSARPGCTDEEAIEQIDVGGPAMLRAAAKNHARVTVVVDPSDYEQVLKALRAGEPDPGLKRTLARKAFAHTARYDALISRFLARGEARTPFPQQMQLGWDLEQTLRYGENPHQAAALYKPMRAAGGTAQSLNQLQGKALSFNNLVDTDTAISCVAAFEEPACVIVKHANPCGAATARSAIEAYRLAYSTDPTSAFGGVIAFNRSLDEPTALAIAAQQLVDVVVAPSVDAAAQHALAAKRGTRVLAMALPVFGAGQLELRTLGDALLVQERDQPDTGDLPLEIVTARAPSAEEMRDLRFAWTVAMYVKSNAIVYAGGRRTLGIGAGQMSRVMSARIAAMKAAEEKLALDGAVMASDAFFPFRDGIDVAAEHGIRAVVQPGGSVRDKEVIAAADEHGIAMVFTGKRHFRH
jgi:phosphoribosylaminoimidazolecarboxamide formyltransferase / IMP cyclohydrolase